ncbi:alpha-amylase family glycosyl hydrolase [Clostridium cellulovorans]|uniref:Alpha amylase catalytic region n=2 Tax=Clostridium cellulovorans TaxID=1493 RepID=D9SVG2_CLOC7|nr:alpha-amylase family glycosyl hydrolase [Clostridium cellulovorans]ADL51086.1 alpha amylase catalytic region [Clostridium cellulovorans 743B]BAV13147.1 alpha amylase catalytic sub domain [Clostridium cellulovorans]
MGKESKLIKLMNILKKKSKIGEGISYAVPDLWNCFDYSSKESNCREDGVLFVNPYDFYSECIEKYILKSRKSSIDYSKSLSKNVATVNGSVGVIGGDWIKSSIIYSMQIRTSTSWDHDLDGYLSDYSANGFKETGTFVKSIALLPLLKKMGITALYLLPISQHSYKYKKGELGSPYAVKDFFALDEELKDPMTGDEMTVEDEFSAFIEGCHILDIRVMIDIIPRTCSRDNNLILTHPYWFYWINLEEVSEYGPPRVESIGQNVKPSEELLPLMYQSENVKSLLKKFTVSPDKYDAVKWREIQTMCAVNPRLNVLDLIEEYMGITTAPAFSDCINDPQAPWEDVTYLRLYLDTPTASKRYMKDINQPPYILNDTIKCNLFQGNEPNEALWSVLADIIPYYQRNFGIDGARIDMGHALPQDLVEMIMRMPRAIDKDFSFIAEELVDLGAAAAKKMGYNMIIGDGFYKEPRWQEHKIHGFIYDSRNLVCPVFAAGEIADSSRLAARYGGKNLVKCATMLNHFMPNGIPFINSGLELYETQPMNTGLDATSEERYRLDINDKYYGKLAFFDKYQLHWNNKDRWEMPGILSNISKIREEYKDTFTNLDNFFPVSCGDWSSPAIALGWIINGKRRCQRDNLILVLANADMSNYRDLYFDLDGIRRESYNASREAYLLYSPNELSRYIYEFDDRWNLKLGFGPGEVKIIKM